MQRNLNLVMFSFGFKYGSPQGVNYLIDVRFLPNPYWVEELRPRNGLEQDVADYILKSESGRMLVSHFESFIKYCIEENRAAEKKSMLVAVGCTGGRHRSVAVVERLAALLAEQGLQLTVYHRDIDRDGDNPS